MDRGRYWMMEVGDSLEVVWPGPAVPAAVRIVALVLLAGLPVAWWGRQKVSAFVSNHLHIGLSPRGVGVIAPVVSVLCAAVAFIPTHHQPLVRWRLDPQELWIESAHGAVRMPWDQVTAARWDSRNPRAEDAALILTSVDGKEAWLVLSWLNNEHRDKILHALRVRGESYFAIPPPVNGPE